MAFKEMNSSGPVLKWTTPGQSVEGRVTVVKNGKVFSGKQSKLAVIETASGAVTIPLPTMLEGLFADNGIGAGHIVRVTYTGTQKSQKGVEFKAFKLEVDDSGPAPQPPSPAAPAASAGEFQKLADALAAKVGAEPAKSMIGALRQIYKTEAEQLDGLRKALAQHGVAA